MVCALGTIFIINNNNIKTSLNDIEATTFKLKPTSNGASDSFMTFCTLIYIYIYIHGVVKG